MGPKQQRTPVVTNAEGFAIPNPQQPRFDRWNVLLMSVLNFIAVAIIVKQLNSLGFLPDWINTDFDSFYKFLPRNSYLVPPCGHLRTRNVLILSNNVVFPDGVEPGVVHIKRFKFQRVEKQNTLSSAALAELVRSVETTGGTVLNFGSLVVSPGIVDVHVHLNEPGRLHWEGITKGTAAAAAGGITTVVDMPLNSDPSITNAKLLKRKISRGWEKAKVDIAYWGGLVPENAFNADVLDKMLLEGAVGLKAFMSPSGMADFGNVDTRDIEAALPVLMRHRKALYLHAEVVSGTGATCDAGCPPRAYSTWQDSRPPSFEVTAAEQIVAAVRAARQKHPALWANATAEGSHFRVHIAHLASAAALPVYRKARDEGLPISIETCPHYLLFSSEEIPDGATQYKCAPPIRDAANRDALRDAVTSGDISILASDHSPAPPDLKELETGDFLKAWGGISGNQYMLPAVNHVAQGVQWHVTKLASLLSSEPAKLAGLDHRKGYIKKGYDADLVIWNPSSPANTSEPACQHRHKVSPYRDMVLNGEVVATIVRGAMVYDNTKGLHLQFNCGWPIVEKK